MNPKVSLLIPARHAGQDFDRTIRTATDYLQSRFPDRWELVLIPNPPPGVTEEDPTVRLCREWSARMPAVVTAPWYAPSTAHAGKGAALKEGYRRSRGQWIWFTDADLPYDLEFFDEASRKLEQGFSFITANRRLPESQFDIPVGLLNLAWRRHRLGLMFNRAVRLFFRVPTTDTQAGIKAMTREFADRAFADQICPGFFFDLEFFLTARGRGFAHSESTVTLFLNSEKSTVRVLREAQQALLWLTRIGLHALKGGYGRNRTPSIPALFQPRSFGEKLFFLIRWLLTPYDRIEARVPRQGRILDLGCGHGLLSLRMAEKAPARRILGIDHDAGRVELGRAAARRLAHHRPITLEFRPGGVSPLPAGPWECIILIDVMHYFPHDEQLRLFEAARKELAPGGTLLFREVDPRPGLASSWNRLYEKISTTVGFTRSEEKNTLYFRTPSEWVGCLEKAGFKACWERCSSPIFSDVLFIARAPLTIEARTREAR